MYKLSNNCQKNGLTFDYVQIFYTTRKYEFRKGKNLSR